MKILVGVKRVVDYAQRVRVNSTTKLVELNNVKMSLNPFCEIAVEEAVSLKENKAANVSEVIALSIGPKQCQETLRTALAMGCDRGIHVKTDRRADYVELQSDAVAKLFQKVLEKEEAGDGSGSGGGVDLVLMGKQAIDSDSGQTGPMLAGYLGWPQAAFAAKVELGEGGSLLVERETDEGTESVKINALPAVVTCDLRLNQPRYATLPNIMKAKKKKIDVYEADEMGVDLEPKNTVLEVFEPPPRKEGITVASVDALLDKLRNEAGAIP